METESFEGQTVVITGASGFIGAALSRRLRDLGATVHGVSRQPRTDGDGCDYWWRSNLAQFDDARRLMTAVRPSTIFHLASHVAGARDVSLVPVTLRDNLVTAVHLLAAATETGCRRVLLAGSLEEPEPGSGWPVPASPYAAAKYAASTYARMFHALYRTPVVLLRFFMVYGPGQWDEKKLVPYVIRSLLEGRAPEISSGRRRIDWIYVDDVVEGCLAAARASGVEGETIDLGSGELATVRDVVERIVALAGPGTVPRFGAVPDRPFEQERLADVARTRARIGWQPRVGLAEGLARTVAWYSKAGEERIVSQAGAQ
ncbi:NAD-dependent epimerase/dehydratase [Sulfurifustis variabilis]|uniref:NAD-dependent epimerase/dehydratase n=1 Tax=Sulfurifustis variabilis TaxID=1675686 RepID=A0A1B4V661_9GAMM|nr:NAD(P)-dependent oxidoreductase [Sulfurifustis variabilis]BAU48082.1 NAD-dependent epimerase/dehydratase [Sulfurifustis variabilis]